MVVVVWKVETIGAVLSSEVVDASFLPVLFFCFCKKRTGRISEIKPTLFFFIDGVCVCLKKKALSREFRERNVCLGDAGGFCVIFFLFKRRLTTTKPAPPPNTPTHNAIYIQLPYSF